jgi:hypothetical protein
MLERIARYILAFLLLLIALEIGSITASFTPSFQDCRREAETEAREKKTKQNEKWITYVIVRCTAVSADANNGIITALAGIAVAFFTYTLWRSTTGLERLGSRQARDTRTSLRISLRGAKAATKSAETSERALNISQRAFVFGKGISAGPNINSDGRTIREYVFNSEIENTGSTPATDVRVWFEIKTLPANEDIDPVFVADEKPPGGVVMGPRGRGRTPYITLPLQTMMRIWTRETIAYIWFRIEYRDIFDPSALHHHEQCSLIDLIHEPSDIPPRDHPSYVIFAAWGPQNSTA